MFELGNLSISELRRLYETNVIYPDQVIEAVYGRIEAAGQDHVWIYRLSKEDALARARQLGNWRPELPLFGIPFAVKDNIDVAGLPTTAACPAFTRTAERNATAVQKALDAGAILIGKTNMDQFATGLVGTRSPYGPCSSVFHPEYISGGSSSGSAVAVAKGQVLFSLGTDTAGSGRVPAAFNGLIGLKPTRGLIGTTGVLPACRSLDCISIFAPDVETAGTVLQALSGTDAEDPYSRSGEQLADAILPPRLGVPQQGQMQFFGDELAERMLAGSCR